MKAGRKYTSVLTLTLSRLLQPSIKSLEITTSQQGVCVLSQAQLRRTNKTSHLLLLDLWIEESR